MVLHPVDGVLVKVDPKPGCEGVLGGVGVFWPYWEGLGHAWVCWPHEGGGGGNWCIIPAIPQPWTAGRGVVIGALGGCHEHTGVALDCDRSTACWDKPGCPGGIIIDCWDKGTSCVVEAPCPCWLHGRWFGYCRGGGAGVPDPIGRAHTGNPTKGRGSCPKEDRVGERDLSIITMMATSKNSSIWCFECYKGEVITAERRKRRKRKGKGKRKRTRKEKRKKKREEKERGKTQTRNREKEKDRREGRRKEPEGGKKRKAGNKEERTTKQRWNSPVIKKESKLSSTLHTSNIQHSLKQDFWKTTQSGHIKRIS